MEASTSGTFEGHPRNSRQPARGPPPSAGRGARGEKIGVASNDTAYGDGTWERQPIYVAWQRRHAWSREQSHVCNGRRKQVLVRIKNELEARVSCGVRTRARRGCLRCILSPPPSKRSGKLTSERQMNSVHFEKHSPQHRQRARNSFSRSE